MLTRSWPSVDDITPVQPPWVPLLPSACQFSWLTNRWALNEPAVWSSAHPPPGSEVTWGNPLFINSFAREKQNMRGGTIKKKKEEIFCFFILFLEGLFFFLMCLQTAQLLLKSNCNLVMAEQIFLQWTCQSFFTFHTTDIRNCSGGKNSIETRLQKLATSSLLDTFFSLRVYKIHLNCIDESPFFAFFDRYYTPPFLVMYQRELTPGLLPCRVLKPCSSQVSRFARDWNTLGWICSSYTL